MSTFRFRYEFELDEPSKRTYDLEVDEATLGLVGEQRGDLPEWTRLEHNQCSHCPLQAGDVVYRRVGDGEVEKLGLAVVSGDGARFLFVDAAGRKAATMTSQELAMQLRRGEVWMLDASKLPIVERGLFGEGGIGQPDFRRDSFRFEQVGEIFGDRTVYRADRRHES